VLSWGADGSGLERRTHNPLVPGSSPGGPTTTSLDRLDSALGSTRGNGEVAIEVGQRLLHYRLTAKIGKQPRIKKARGERES
jgi:hypothetical protein